jgi:Tfp pilus assembly protein PilN
LLTVVLLSLCVLLLIGFLISPVWIEGKRLEEIEQQIALRKEEVRKVEALKKEIDVINSEIVAVEQFKRNREMVLDVMKNLSTILPQNAWLSRLRVTGTIVEIEGYAHSATEVLSKLEASNAFKKAEFATQTIKDGRTNTDRFSIRMQTAHQSKLHVKALKDEKK